MDSRLNALLQECFPMQLLVGLRNKGKTNLNSTKLDFINRSNVKNVTTSTSFLNDHNFTSCEFIDGEKIQSVQCYNR